MTTSRAAARRRLLLVNQFYPPDQAPTGVYLHDFARYLAAAGQWVDVVAGRVSYDGAHAYPARTITEGVLVRRVWTPRLGRLRLLARLLGYACYLIGVWWRIAVGPRCDVVVALTTPPLLGWVVALAARFRGIPHAHWVMDTWPDALVADGLLTSRSWLFARLSHLARRHLGAAATVVALGEAMAQRLRRYRCGPIAVVPLWSTIEPASRAEIAALRQRLGWPTDAVVFAYSGNLGRGHRWRDFVEVATACRSEAHRWVFLGGGVRRRELERWCREHPDHPLTLLAAQPAADLPALLGAIDVHLVSVERGWEGIVVPSKVQNIARAGRPLLVVAPAAAEPARWTAVAGAGWVIAPGDTIGLQQAVVAASDGDLRLQGGAAADRLAAERFAAATGLAAMTAVILAVAGKARPRPTLGI